MRQGLPTKIDLEKSPQSLYEGIDYKQFWHGLQKHNLDQLERTLVIDMLPVSGNRIVDLGCGFGRLSDCYTGRFQQVIMVDGSISLLRQAYKKTGGQAIYIACDVRNLPFRAASFDAVLMIRVFHHIDESQACISEFNRLLCKDGRLVFNFCNKQNLKRVILWLVGIDKRNPYSLKPDGVNSTFISHNPKAIHGMLLEASFVRIKYYGAGVVDWIIDKTGLVGKHVRAARFLALFFGWSKIAPWLFCQAVAKGNSDLVDTKLLTDLLQCPSCGGNILEENEGYRCLKCRRRYPVVDGIIDFRLP